MDTLVPLVVHPLAGPADRPAGHGPADPYIEAFWLPTLGPTATWLWRRLASVTTAAAGPVTFDVEDLGRQLGLTGSTVSVRKSLQRLCRFGLAHQWSHRTYGVEVVAPALRVDQIRHLTKALQELHAAHDRQAVSA